MLLMITLLIIYFRVPDFDIALIRLDHPATLILDDFVTPVLPVCLHPPLIPSLETK